MKPDMHLLEIILRPTKMMQEADKNWARFSLISKMNGF